MKNLNVTFTTIFLALACFGLLPQIEAAPQVAPAPDGCYPGFTTAEGCNALQFLGAGAGNTGLGWYSLYLVGGGNFNTGVGAGTLVLNTADSNTAVGAAALLLNTTGTQNVAVGTDALVYNDSGSNNNAFGAFALFNNMDGVANNAFGTDALLENIHASDNTAVGHSALFNNDITGNNVAVDNTAVGAQALFSNSDGDSNTAVGFQALYDNDTGTQNTAVGNSALLNNDFGNQNVAIGDDSLLNNVSASGNTVVGAVAGSNIVAGSFNTYIGEAVAGAVDESHTVRIADNLPSALGVSACFIGGIVSTVQSGAGIDSVTIRLADGRLGHPVSSRRYKEEIKPMDKASEALFALQPVMFRYKKQIDPQQGLDYGLIAEDVAKVAPELAVRNGKGEIENVRYQAIYAMMLNEFLKEHRKVEEQKAAIAALKSVVALQQREFQATIAEQRKEFEARLQQQDAKIQTVSAQIELNKLASATLANNQ
jgi:hypothetical protein